VLTYWPSSSVLKGVAPSEKQIPFGNDNEKRKYGDSDHSGQNDEFRGG